MEIYVERQTREYQNAEDLVVLFWRDVHSLQVGFDHVQVAFGDRRLLAAHDGEIAVLETVEHSETQCPVEAADLVGNWVLQQTEKNWMNGFWERGPFLLLDPLLLVEDDVVPNRPSRSRIVNVLLR